MATSTVGQNASPMRHYYTPSNEIKLAPGVVRNVTDTYTNTYWDTAESLSASGLAPLSVFPGQPGQPVARVSLRPRGVPYYGRVPGHLTIYASASGKMRAVLAVSEEEQVRRVAVVKAREDAATAAAQDILAQIPAHRLAYLKEICKHSGLRNAKQWFRNKDYLASQGIDKGPQMRY